MVGRIKQLSKDLETGHFLLTLELTGIPNLENKIGCQLDISLEKHREKRSLNANAYAWVLMQKLAELHQTDKESIYLEMLRRYSRVFSHVLIRPEAVEAFKREFSKETRVIEELGTVIVNGQRSTQLRCYFGSSSFNTKQMAVFLDGIVRECQDAGIEVLTPQELERMKVEWGK